MNKILSSIYTFLFIGVLFLGCNFWIYKNIKVSDLIGNTSVSNNSEKKIESEEKIKVEVRNNDIVQVVSPDAVKLIVDGSKIEDFESFADINISPDGMWISFIVHTITPQWLYVSNINGSNLNKIALARNSYWSPNSKYIAYNNHTTDVSPIDIYVSHVYSGITKNLTFSLYETGYFKQYSDIKWLNDNIIEAKYMKFPENDLTKVTEGVVQIDADPAKWNHF
jgi:hypothetical protein